MQAGFHMYEDDAGRYYLPYERTQMLRWIREHQQRYQSFTAVDLESWPSGHLYELVRMLVEAQRRYMRSAPDPQLIHAN